MTHALNSAIDRALCQREVLARAVECTNEEGDEEETLRLEYLLQAWDGLLAIMTSGEARH